MRPNLMATSSMTPLSRTGVQGTILDETQRLAGERAMYAAAALPLTAKPEPTAADDDDKEKDKKKKDDDKDSKSKKAADDDEDDDKKDKKKKDDDAKAILAAERARMLTILDSAAGKASFAANPEKTLRFVLMHSGAPEEAIATLELFGGNLQSTKTPPLRDRMEGVRVEVGPDAVSGPPNDTAAMAQAIIMAGKKRRGEID